jgi:hypothetical protein
MGIVKFQPGPFHFLSNSYRGARRVRGGINNQWHLYLFPHFKNVPLRALRSLR